MPAHHETLKLELTLLVELIMPAHHETLKPDLLCWWSYAACPCSPRPAHVLYAPSHAMCQAIPKSVAQGTEKKTMGNTTATMNI